ncbi:MAG: transcriptional repressor [Gammaproteobacteria bacterium]|nr:transcriptional repressor [Gammaproteobacteria bacterium]
MAEAAEVCNARGARLTPLRARVLEIVWRSHRPLGAYAILEVLSDEGRTPAPPTVYRALEFLTEQGLVHRLASLNAFIGCSQPGHPGTCQFLLCRSCGTVAELDDPAIRRAIQRTAVTEGFEAHEHTVEVSGICPNCQQAS